MNQTFSPARFGRLLHHYFVANRGQLLAGLVLLLGVMIVAFILIYSETPPEVESLRLPLLFIPGWIAWYVFIWQQTDTLNNKERSMAYFMQPASQVEKILLIWFVTGICFLLVYLTCFTLMDLIGVSYVNNRDWNAGQVEQIRMRGGLAQLTPFYASTDKNIPNVIVWITVLFHPFALAFLLVFRWYNLATVAVMAFLLLVFLYLSNRFIAYNMTNINDAVSIRPFDDAIVRSPDQRSYRTIALPQPLGNQLRYTLVITIGVLLYITAYFRLKEREV
ncbi:hypothetical protein [Spirosoma utsteinense]|uniref:Membrane protein n=1 Tax=Spirosoma utsteinense TaxID=2585773 RepID=A0ABR6WAC2_9BACT|nr:hypothetical protein [Spirosoma utsteinense]MBC3784003.1 putative membrane protein [Spirosoma utsteinense]MBC3793509.1 putative membrane protein [Spirosoma utsteinense]